MVRCYLYAGRICPPGQPVRLSGSGRDCFTGLFVQLLTHNLAAIAVSVFTIVSKCHTNTTNNTLFRSRHCCVWYWCKICERNTSFLPKWKCISRYVQHIALCNIGCYFSNQKVYLGIYILLAKHIPRDHRCSYC